MKGKSSYFFRLTPSFLALMQEKRQKKIKPSRMAFPYRVREGEGMRKELLLFRLDPIMYPANLAGVPDALIFFCFFSCIKARKGPLPRAGKFAGYVKGKGAGKSLYFFHLTISFVG